MGEDAATPKTHHRLRMLRLAAGLTQRALAERAGVSLRTICYLERGDRSAYPSTRRRLLAALGIGAHHHRQVFGPPAHAARMRNPDLDPSEEPTP